MTALVFAAMGCAHERQRLSASAVRATEPRTLLLHVEANGAFDANRPKSALTILLAPPLVTLSSAATEGPGIANEDRLVDPAFDVGDALADALVQTYSLDRVTVTQDSPPGDPTPVVRRPRVGADLVLDVRTTWWGIRFAPSQRLGRYAVHLEMEAVLTDLRSGKVLARGACIGDDPKTAAGRLYDDFEADRGALVRQQLALAADRCAYFLGTKTLSLPDELAASFVR
jgi:hypothetical protein